MTNANRLSKSARCSSSCSLLENKLNDPDCDIEATLAEKNITNYHGFFKKEKSALIAIVTNE